MELFKASNQWATRPADESFNSLAELHAANVAYREASLVSPTTPYASLRAEAQDNEVVILGKKSIPAKLTHWAFGQLCARVKVPAGFLREQPATLATQNLNWGLKRLSDGIADDGDDRTANLLIHKNGGMQVHGFNSEKYSRIWNDDITNRLLELEAEHGWSPAPAAFDGKRGLYASAHDMFVFMVDNQRRIFEKSPGGGLSRGFFVENSLVGASKLRFTRFLYAFVCGNHIVWGAQDVVELALRHVGSANERAMQELEVEVTKYLDSSPSDEEAMIASAKKRVIAATPSNVLDAIFGKKIPALTQKLLADGQQKATEHADWYGDPNTVWGMVNGITEVARDFAYADRRVEVERAASKLLTMEF